jgi:hypothetical protein
MVDVISRMRNRRRRRRRRKARDRAMLDTLY